MEGHALTTSTPTTAPACLVTPGASAQWVSERTGIRLFHVKYITAAKELNTTNVNR